MNMHNKISFWVIEDDLDFELLIKVKLQSDTRFTFFGSATNSVDAIELVRDKGLGVIILDHFIEGAVMGLQLAPLLKFVAPHQKIILLTTHDLESEASRVPAIDAYLRKDQISRLLPTALKLLGQDLTGMSG